VRLGLDGVEGGSGGEGWVWRLTEGDLVGERSGGGRLLRVGDSSKFI